MKDALRQQMLELRNNIPKHKILKNNEKIKKRFFKLKEFSIADTLLFYVSYNNEVDTHNMIKKCISNDKRVIVPLTNKKNRRLILSELKNWNDLNRGTYGIMEPLNEQIKEVPLNIIDIIVVPGVAFDKSGNRIGHGLGYYDGLLKNSTKIIKIGLAFELQLVDKIPVESHDIRVNKIITEERTISCPKIM